MRANQLFNTNSSITILKEQLISIVDKNSISENHVAILIAGKTYLDYSFQTNQFILPSFHSPL